MLNTLWSSPGSSICVSMGEQQMRIARHFNERVDFTSARRRQTSHIRSQRADRDREVVEEIDISFQSSAYCRDNSTKGKHPGKGEDHEYKRTSSQPAHAGQL